VQVAWLLGVRVCAMLKRTVSITQAGACGVRPLDPEPSLLTIALRHRSRLHIFISKTNYRKISRLGEHNTQGTLIFNPFS